ncbi:MAG: hypothetical protein RIB47_12600 [Cyclobacteriaceae bacterium]
MMRITLWFICISISISGIAQVGSEIYLFDMEVSKSEITVRNPVNVTNHPDYDNQPSFHKSESILYYSSFNEDGRADIKAYNFETEESISFTNTQEREYSPTVTPDGEFISCIIQRDNDAQDLGKYPIGGGEPITLIDDLIVGYHAWVDQQNLILFVLGEPATLGWYDLKSGSNEVLGQNIGRSLHKIPGEPAMSFVQKAEGKFWEIKRLDIRTREVSSITKTLDGREDLAWTEDGKILMSDGKGLFFFDTKRSSKWRPVKVESAGVEFKNVTRLAISHDGKKLALVSEE